jgi:hypothetical protein
MSYVVNPLEGDTTNPVGTQELSSGVPTPNSLLSKASEQMHESALRDESFKAVVSEAVSDMFALKPNWKPKSERVKFVIQCPSGQKVLAKHLNTMDLLEADLVEDLDFFTKRLFPSNVDESGNVIENDEDEDSTIWNVLRDIEKRRKFIDLLNRLIDIAIEKPNIINDGIQIATRDNGTRFLISGSEMSPEDYVRVFGHPLPELKENETYASAVDFTDKMTIFGELNKPLSVIQPFRQEPTVGLASMEPSESVRAASE